jgi:cysteine sulfinate desulfinase/cysteine desulfurase-like protein
MCGADRAASAIRISLGDATTSSDVDEALSMFLRVLRSHPSSG